ncbi:hypothetical protein FS842_004544 [Serendipita sp. 407]|nr:hypothetical protein FS842_004544 [Serendipita sp. 407]
MGLLSLSLSTLICCLLARTAHGYIPAVPSNATEGSTLDVHDNSQATLTWAPNGVYSTVVSYQQAGNASRGISQGALIKVKEEDMWITDSSQSPSSRMRVSYFKGSPFNLSAASTPWIALINCDKNATNATMDNDIFAMVRDRGAVAALLYSNTSDGCLLNLEYHNSDGFDHIFDIFTSKKVATSMLIQAQFTNVNEQYRTYDPKLLNDSAALIQTAIVNGTNTSPYLVATLRADNTTVPEVTSGGTSQTPNAAMASHNGRQSLAMVILSVAVSLVFNVHPTISSDSFLSAEERHLRFTTIPETFCIVPPLRPEKLSWAPNDETLEGHDPRSHGQQVPWEVYPVASDSKDDDEGELSKPRREHALLEIERPGAIIPKRAFICSEEAGGHFSGCLRASIRPGILVVAQESDPAS